MSHLRRVAIEGLNAVINHDVLFWIVGRCINIESVFLVYPASDKYALAYAYPWRLQRQRWKPWPAGVLLQNGKIGVMFAISANDSQISEKGNSDDLHNLADRMERLRRLFGAKRKTFAGILPGILSLRGIVGEAPEAELTAVAVAKAIKKVKAKESLDGDTPIIVLGGRGFVGRRVMSLLDDSITYCVDVIGGGGNWPAHLDGKRVILINITLSNTLDEYLTKMWPGTVVINEVYPEPTQTTLQILKDRKCNCYHVVGVNAWALPPFPGAYEGAIPCCAAWPDENMDVVIRKIN